MSAEILVSCESEGCEAYRRGCCNKAYSMDTDECVMKCSDCVHFHYCSFPWKRW